MRRLRVNDPFKKNTTGRENINLCGCNTNFEKRNYGHRKFSKIIAGFFLLLLCFIITPTYAIDSDGKNVKNQLIEETDKALNSIDFSEIENFFNSLDGEYKAIFGSSIKQMLLDTINGTKVYTANEFIQVFISSFTMIFKKILPTMILIISLTIAVGFLKNLSSGFAQKSVTDVINIVCCGAIIALMGFLIFDLISSVKNAIKGVDKILTIIMPIMLTLTTALSGIGTVKVFKPMTVIMSSVIIKVINTVIIPIFIATTVFTFIGSFSTDIKLDKLSKTTKSAGEWILGTMFSIFLAVITTQGIITSTFDNVALSTTKFALASYVPILGGYLSDGFDVVMASCVLIKNGLGLISLIILFVVILVPVIKLAVISFAFKLASSTAELVSETKISKLLFDTSKNLNVLLAIILGVGFIIFIMFLVLILAFNVGGM